MKLLNKIKRIQALAEIGLEYAEIHFDRERYEELNTLALEMMEMIISNPIEDLKSKVMEHNGYRTPKVDVRGIVLNEKKEVLLIKEKADGKWAMPGGWADVSYSPKEVAEKEVWEEAGVTVKAKRLVAHYFNERHNAPDIWSIYKLFIHCEFVEGVPHIGDETSDVSYFSLDNLPPLSGVRNTESQIKEVVDLILSNNLYVPID